MADDYFKSPDEITDPRKINSAFAELKKTIKSVDDKISSSPLVDYLYTSDTWRMTETADGIVFQQFENGIWNTVETVTTEGIPGTGGSLVYSYIKATSQAEGDLHLSDASNWNIDKAHISKIKVVTSSTNWELFLLQNDNGYATNDANIPMTQLMGNGNGDLEITVNEEYEDEDASKEVHLYYNDVAGTDTADFYIEGYELQ